MSQSAQPRPRPQRSSSQSSAEPARDSSSSEPVAPDVNAKLQRPGKRPKPLRRRVGGELDHDVEMLVGLRPEVPEHDWRSTAPHTMKVGRRILIPHDTGGPVGKWWGSNTKRWFKRLFREDFPVITLATGAALFGLFVFAGTLPDPQLATRAAILKTALVAAVAEEGVLFPLAFAFTSIRNHRLHGMKSLRAIGRGLKGTAVRMAGLFTAKTLLGLTVHTAAIAAGAFAASFLPIGVAASWAIGVVVGNVLATGAMLGVADVAERGLICAGRKGRAVLERVFPGLQRRREKQLSLDNQRVRSAQKSDRDSWVDRQEWLAINNALKTFDRVGGGKLYRKQEDVEPNAALQVIRRRLSDYRVSNYALMVALEETCKEPEFRKRLEANDPTATRLASLLDENDRSQLTQEQREADDKVYHRRRVQLEKFTESNPETNPFLPEFDRLQRENDLLVNVANDVVELGGAPARHIRAAVEESALRDSDWGEEVLALIAKSSNVFRKPAVDIVNDPIELVREPVLRKFETPALSLSSVV